MNLEFRSLHWGCKFRNHEHTDSIHSHETGHFWENMKIEKWLRTEVWALSIKGQAEQGEIAKETKGAAKEVRWKPRDFSVEGKLKKKSKKIIN